MYFIIFTFTSVSENVPQDQGAEDSLSFVGNTSPGGDKKLRKYKRHSPAKACRASKRSSSHVAISKTSNLLVNSSQNGKGEEEPSQLADDPDHSNEGSSSDEDASLIEFVKKFKKPTNSKPMKTGDVVDNDVLKVNGQQPASRTSTVEGSDGVNGEKNEKLSEDDCELFVLDSSTEDSPPKVDVGTEDQVETDQVDSQPEHVCSDGKIFEKQLGFSCNENTIAKDESEMSFENKSVQQDEKYFDVERNHSSESKKDETNVPNSSSSNVSSLKPNDSFVITTSCLDKSNLENSVTTPKVECTDHSYLSSFSVNSSAPQMSLKSIMDEKIPYSMFSSNSESKLEAWATPNNSTIQVENSILTKDDTSSKLETSVKLTSTPIPTKLKENLSVDNSLFEDKEEDLNGTKEVEKLCISEIPALNGNSSPTHIGIPIRRELL